MKRYGSRNEGSGAVLRLREYYGGEECHSRRLEEKICSEFETGGVGRYQES